MTKVSLRHCVDAQAVSPTRAVPLQSERPALLPCTEMLLCAVEGCWTGETSKIPRGRTISGKTMFDCVCNGRPSAPKIDTLVKIDDPTALVNPGIWHTMADDGETGADGSDRCKINGPFGGENAGNTVTLETFKFRHAAPAAELLLKEAKRSPVIDTVAKATLAVIAKETVKVTF